MNYPENVGGIDRIIRGVLGIWLVVVAAAAYLDGQRAKAAIAGRDWVVAKRLDQILRVQRVVRYRYVLN